MKVEYIFPNIIRFVLVVLLQAFLFNEFFFTVQGLPFGKVILFPLFIALLPLDMASVVVVLFSFLLGISIDVLVNSPGVYACAATFVGFFRMILVKMYEPRGGYKVNTIMSQAHYGRRWYYKIMSWMLALGIFVYYLAEVFTFSKFGFIFQNVVTSFVFSSILVLLISFILNPKR